MYRGRSDGQLFLDCQADRLSHLKTRFVIPLLPAATFEGRAGALNPAFTIGGEKMVLGTHFAFTIPLSELGAVVADLTDDNYAVLHAIDTLIGSA